MNGTDFDERAATIIGQTRANGKAKIGRGTVLLIGAALGLAAHTHPHHSPANSPVPKGAKRVTVTMTHSFEKPGTYFAALRGASHRQGDTRTPYARIGNLARARVVVK